MTFLRKYSVPIVLAVLLHAFAIVSPLAFGFDRGADNEKFTIEPRAISASLVILEQPNLRPTQTLPPTLTEPAPLPVEEPPADPFTEEPIEQIDEVAQREEKRLLLLEELREQAFADELANELNELESEQFDDRGTTYVNAIYSAVVQQWSRPPSARRDMEAILRVELFPSGKLNSVGLVKSSGNDAFDRSALEAVRSVPKFEVPQNIRLFERRFRTFDLKFKAKDLLR